MLWNPARVAAADPGIEGALICLDAAGVVLDAIEMPTVATQRASGRTRNLVDGPAVRAWIQKWAPAHFVIEQQGARPKQGIASTATTMRHYGLLEGIAVGLGLPYSIMAPQAWRAAIKAPVGKPGSWIACGRLAPAARTAIEERLKNKVLRIAACDAWGMCYAWMRDNPAATAPLSNEDFFA